MDNPPTDPNAGWKPEHLAARARRRRRAEAALDVPDTCEGFDPDLRPMLEPVGLDAAHLWFYIRRLAPPPCTLDFALEAGFLLDMDAAAVGRALDALRLAELIAGDGDGFAVLNPAVPF